MIHAEMCMPVSRESSVLKFKFEDFEGINKRKDASLEYGGLGTSCLVKHKQNSTHFILKTVLGFYFGVI